MGKLTSGARSLLEQLAVSNTRIVHAPDGDCAWLSPRKDLPAWNDLDWDDMAELRRAGYIADLDDGDDESRFPPVEVITEAGRRALSEQGKSDA